MIRCSSSDLWLKLFPLAVALCEDFRELLLLLFESKNEPANRFGCRFTDAVQPVSYTHLTLPTILLV